MRWMYLSSSCVPMALTVHARTGQRPDQVLSLSALVKPLALAQCGALTPSDECHLRTYGDKARHAGLFVYGYCFYYYLARSDMSGFMQTSFFFGALLSVALADVHALPGPSSAALTVHDRTRCILSAVLPLVDFHKLSSLYTACHLALTC